MKNDPKTPKRSESEKVQHNQIIEAIKDRVLLKRACARKPIYLTRYELFAQRFHLDACAVC